MKKFANEIGDILATVDIRRPRDFDELVKYGFNDCPPETP
jgi:hypothetical protein